MRRKIALKQNYETNKGKERRMRNYLVRENELTSISHSYFASQIQSYENSFEQKLAKKDLPSKFEKRVLLLPSEEKRHMAFQYYLKTLEKDSGDRAFQFLKRLPTPREENLPEQKRRASKGKIPRGKSVFMRGKESMRSIKLPSAVSISSKIPDISKHKQFFNMLRAEMHSEKSISPSKRHRKADTLLTSESMQNLDKVIFSQNSEKTDIRSMKRMRRGTHTTLFMDYEKFFIEEDFNLPNFFGNLRNLIRLVNNNKGKITNILTRVIFFFPGVKSIFFEGEIPLFMPFEEESMRSNLIESVFGLPKASATKGVLEHNKEALNNIRQAGKMIEEIMINQEKISIHSLTNSILESQKMIVESMNSKNIALENIDTSFLSLKNGNFKKFSTQKETSVFEQKLGKLDFLTERNRIISNEIDNSIYEIGEKLVF